MNDILLNKAATYASRCEHCESEVREKLLAWGGSNEETDKIISAQKARGADFSNGSLIKRAKALIPILVPLFISAFRRADELAIAMECRCYRGGEGRTKLHILKYKAQDVLLILLFSALLAGLILMNSFAIEFSFVGANWF